MDIKHSWIASLMAKIVIRDKPYIILYFLFENQGHITMELKSPNEDFD